MKDLEIKERYGKQLIEEEIKNMNELSEVNKLEEIERDMLAKLKQTQVKEQQSLVYLNNALNEQKAAA